MKKPMRTVSGVTPIAVMTVGDCPGLCIYCPRGEAAAKSYTGFEPAARRARTNYFDPKKQVLSRISQLEEMGHPTGKIDLIIMGGTLAAMPRTYVEKFVKGCFDALNGEDSRTLDEAQKKNETARHRSVGLVIETRPDFVDTGMFLGLGATKVELGVQILDDDVYKKIRRGHTVSDVAEATKTLKEAGFKICYHMMPGLPGADDEKSFRLLFEDEKFRPDMLKIYPTLVIPGTELYEMWKRGEYEPPTVERMTKLIADLKESLPKWVRIMRVQRDIPVNQLAAGIRQSHLRELVWGELRKRGKRCGCIRCREVGRLAPQGEIRLKREDYRASGGDEIFLSFEAENGALVALLRLRLDRNATVRELHVFGREAAIGNEGEYQHKGYGEKLLKEAEKIAEGKGYKNLRVISGVGAREYYRKKGYELSGDYMSRQLKRSP